MENAKNGRKEEMSITENDDPFAGLPPPSMEAIMMVAIFDKWLRESIGFPGDLFLDLLETDDWTFVIKLHALVEAGLNHLLTSHFKRPELEDVFSGMENSNTKSGKLAFIFRR